MAYLSTTDVDSIGDDDISQILGLSQNASQQDKLALQQRLANALRNKDSNHGQSVPQGSVFLPPNPLTSAMDIFDHLQGITQGQQGIEQGKQLDAQRQSALDRFAKLWINRNKKKQDTVTPDSNSDLGYGDDDSNL